MNEIKASKRQIKAIERKRDLAESMGDVRTLYKCQALLIYFRADIALHSIAEICGVTYETVRQWVCQFACDGIKSLAIRRPRGRQPKLSKAQCRRLAEILDRPPHESGLTGGCWTSGAIQTIIHREFKVKYAPKYIPELLKRLGFSFQKAKFESAHIDPKKRLKWLQDTWPDILAQAKRNQAHIFFEDEASFSLWGSLFYTWARRGKQPVVKTTGQRKSLKVFGVIEIHSGKLIYQAVEGKLNADSYKTFLTEVLKKTRKQVIIVHDGASYHTAKATTEFVASKSRLSMYRLPPYSPDYNPIEGLWKKVKKTATHLMYFPEFKDLVAAVKKCLNRFLSSPDEILRLFGFYRKLKPSTDQV